jgi:DNA-directed RNA polymerase subunit RPC12/RpoP
MNREQPGLTVDISQTTAVSCEKCKHDVFIPAFKMRKLSALLSPAGKETMVPVNVFACAKCGHINEEFLPKLKEENDTL